MKKIIVVNNGTLPLPAVRGGAVETLIELLIKENEKRKKFLFEVYSIYDEKALEAAKLYSYTSFCFVKTHDHRGAINHFVTRLVNYVSLRAKGFYHPFLLHRQIAKNVNKNKGDYAAIILEGTSYSAHYLKKKTGLPIIQRVHNIPPRTAVRFTIQSAKSTYLYMGISKFICQNLQQFEGKYCKNIELLYNSIDFSLFQQFMSNEEKSCLRKMLGFDDKDFIIMFSGRLREFKGVKQLLEAMLLLSDICDLKLLVVGSYFFSSSIQSSFEKSLLPLIKQLGNKVKFTGFVEYKDMYKYYNIANLCAFPSIWEEPFALTCLEALVCGRPVVITKSGGMVEVVNEKCAVILPNDSNLAENLAASIKELKGNPIKLSEMAVAAKTRARLFTPEKQYDQFSSLMGKYIHYE